MIHTDNAITNKIVALKRKREKTGKIIRHAVFGCVFLPLFVPVELTGAGAGAGTGARAGACARAGGGEGTFRGVWC